MASRLQGLAIVGRFALRLAVRNLSSGKIDQEAFNSLLKKNSLVLFMKGVPSTPMCGFSKLVVQILNMHGVENYDYYNVLEDVEFKEAIKEYSNWPTFPQVYMNGEFLGGSDILLQMHQNGELIEELKKVGHESKLSQGTS